MTRHLRGFAASARRRARFVTATCRRRRSAPLSAAIAGTIEAGLPGAAVSSAKVEHRVPAGTSHGEERTARAPVVLPQRLDLTLHQPLLACMRRRCICAAPHACEAHVVASGYLDVCFDFLRHHLCIHQACTRISRPASRRRARPSRSRVAGSSRRARRRASALCRCVGSPPALGDPGGGTREDPDRGRAYSTLQQTVIRLARSPSKPITAHATHA